MAHTKTRTHKPTVATQPASAPPSPPGTAGPQINLRWLEIFVAVVKNGSMTLAARELGLTQSAVSQALRGLEQSVGTSLIDRSIRPPALTLAGSTVMKHAVDLVDRARALQHSLQFRTQEQLPVLRIGMVDSFATTVGPHLVDRLRDMAAQWMVASGVNETRISGLIERRVDFIITSDETRVPDELVAMPLLAEPYFLLLPASYRLPVTSLRELAASLDLIRYGRNLYITQRIERYLHDSRIEAPRRYQMDTVDAVIAMVDAGLGWTISTPLGFLKGAGGARNVRCLPLPGKPMVRRLNLLARREGGLTVASRIAEVSVEVLRSVFLRQIVTMLPSLTRDVRLGNEAGGRG